MLSSPAVSLVPPVGQAKYVSPSKAPSWPEIFNEQLARIVAKEYRISIKALLTSQRKHINSEARAMCFYLLRQYTSLSYSQMATMYNLLNKGAIHRQVSQIGDWLGALAQRNKALVAKYESIKAQLDAFVAEYNGPRPAGSPAIAPFDSEPEAAEESFSEPVDQPHAQIPLASKSVAPTEPVPSKEAEFLNYTGSEPVDVMEAPDVTESPLAEPVIDRHNLDGISKVLNKSSLVEDAKIAEPTPEPPSPANPQPAAPAGQTAPGFTPGQIDISGLDDDTEPVAEPAPQAPSDNVGPMQFDVPPGGLATDQPGGYQMPPEAAEKMKAFTTSSVLGMVELLLPGIAFRTVEISETETRSIVDDAPEKVKDKALKDVRKINHENRSELEREVKAILPYMKGPLEHIVSRDKLKMSPGAALAVFGIYLIGVMYLAVTKMMAQRKQMMSDLRELMAEHRAEMGK